ncbi:MAG TPA: class I SAM-dependent methyltransferase [Ktedonobacterales bacterium]
MATFHDIMRDKAQVRDNLYGDPAKLGARVDLQRRFSVNPQPIADWELGLVDLSGIQQALDAGCGTGAFLLPLARRLTPRGATVIGLDLSEGTLGQARARVQAESLPVDCVIGDVEALPFADSSFDLVLANYMLYHVPDLDQAIAELRRVLRPGGTLLAATNGQGHMRELWQLEKHAFIHAGVSPQTVAALMERGRAAGALSFRLENGEQWLRRSFTDVRLERYPDELRVTEVEPLVAYFASLWSLDQMVEGAMATPQDQTLLHTRVVDSFRAIVQERIATDGVVRIAKDTGAFVAR